MPELTTEQKTERGQRIAQFLSLKPAKDGDGKRYKPERYHTKWHTKTALGLFESIARLMEGDEL